MYIVGNHKVYPTDFDKINSVLSFMNSSEAAAWNEQFVEEQPNLENLDLGTWDDFKKNLGEAFSPYNVPGEARKKFKRLQKEGKTPMNKHIAMFKTLVTQAKSGKDKEALCDLFLETCYDSIFVLLSVRGRSASSDVSSDISPSPLYIPPHRR